MSKDKSALPDWMEKRQIKCLEINKDHKKFGQVVCSPQWKNKNYELHLYDLTETELNVMLNAFKSLRRFETVKIDTLLIPKE